MARYEPTFLLAPAPLGYHLNDERGRHIAHLWSDREGQWRMMRLDSGFPSPLMPQTYPSLQQIREALETLLKAEARQKAGIKTKS